jgi:hypothetical protein
MDKKYYTSIPFDRYCFRLTQALPTSEKNLWYKQASIPAFYQVFGRK